MRLQGKVAKHLPRYPILRVIQKVFAIRESVLEFWLQLAICGKIYVHEVHELKISLSELCKILLWLSFIK